MALIEVTINGRPHQLQVGDGEESRARRLASYVDGIASKLVQQHGAVGESKLLLLSCLMIADEYADALEEVKRLRAAVEKGAGTEEAEAAAALALVAERLERLAAAVENA